MVVENKLEFSKGVGDILDGALDSLRYCNPSQQGDVDGQSIVQDLFQMEIESSFAYYPIDIVELRHFIEQDSISLGKPSVLFSLRFIRKHCSDYPLVIGVNIKGLDGKHGGAFIDYDCLSLKERLKRLYIFRDLDKQAVCNIKDIINDTETKIDIIKDIKMPGVILASNKKIIKTSQVVQGDDISLDGSENRILNFLIEAKNNSPELVNTEIRVAGGWVRDKVMGKESDDIDVAVSYKPESEEAKAGKYISGFEFAKIISKYAKAVNAPSVGEVHSVSLEKTADPKKKSTDTTEELQVGGMRIFGLKIEFVGLRIEAYDEESRTPEIAPTNNIQEDVLRRDLTINSMYYNPESKAVEDYAGGREDIQNKVLRTPTDPQKTFTEDPLRMLRVLRFSSKLPDFQISPDILEVMEQSKDPESEFSKSYTSKIAPSRASKEIRKMMEGADPVGATRTMLTTDFYKLVFNMPKEWHSIGMDQQSPFHNATFVEHTMGVMQELFSLAKENGMSDKERGMTLLGGMLHDFGKMHPDIRVPKIDKMTGQPVTFERGDQQIERRMYMGHADESASFATKILKSMNFTEEERTFISTMVKGHMEPHHIADALESYQGKEEGSAKQKKSLVSLKGIIGKFLGEVDGKLDKLQQAIANIQSAPNMSEEDRKASVASLQAWIPIFDNAWRRIMEHGMADAIAKGNLTDEETQKIKESRIKTLNFVKSYREMMGELTRKPVAREGFAVGDEIRRIMKEEIPNLPDNAIIGEGHKATHYIRYVINKIMEQQRKGFISTADQMEQYIRDNAKNWRNMIQQSTKSNNWYKNIKLADASSGADPSGFDGYEEKSPAERASEDIVRVNYDGVPMPFQEGDEVVLRFGGLGQGRMRGIVRAIGENGDYLIEWQTGDYKGKIERVSIDQAQIKLDKA